jgi:hypothetical protein
LSRAAESPSPGDEAAALAFRGQVAEAWRFPIIGLMREQPGGTQADELNLVTFVYKTRPGDSHAVNILGTFHSLCKPLPLRGVLFGTEDTGYRSLSVAVPKGELHRYLFEINGEYHPDPINPQQVRLGNGRIWSRFFTDEYLQPLILELWELRLLYRLIEQILPFRTAEAENFLNRYYFERDNQGRVVRRRENEVPKAFRLDGSVGEVNAIDKLLAREEAHRLVDYRICFKQIDRALRVKEPYVDPYQMHASTYTELYNAMAASKPGDGSVPGWDYTKYDNPAHFIYLLRRHAVTTAFGHPRYAGNVGAAGWAYLAERYTDDQSRTFFDWRPAIEKPLGTSEYYR